VAARCSTTRRRSVEPTTDAYLHRSDEAELRWMGDTSTHFLATGETTGGAFVLVDERAPRGTSVPLHLHREDMESFYVLEGEITLYIGDQPKVRISAGSFAHLPGGTVHGFSRRVGNGPLSNPDDATARAVLPCHHAALSARRAPAT
jgi:quercetin dioxygenase-like cupin family protein